MKQRISSVLMLILWLVTCANPAVVSAQQPGISIWPGRPDLTSFPSVSIPFSAWDENGLPLTGLAATDITLQENGGAPFHPEQLIARTDAELQVVLAIDVSKSMQGKPLDDAKIAAVRFLDRLSPADRAGLLAFAGEVNPDPTQLAAGREAGLSKDKLPLFDQIEKLSADGSTALYRAASKAVGMLKDAPAGHRAVLLLSDGKNDPPDLGDPAEAIRLAQAQKIPFFVIGLGGQVDEPYLRRLANETGGLYRAAPISSELARLFGDMASLLKTRYILSYPSHLPASGGSATLSVRLAYQGTEGEIKLELGPLPLAATATSAPPPTATALPSPSPIPPSATVPVPTATSAPLPSPESGFPWIFLAGAGLLLAALGAGLFLRRKSAPRGEACAKCGYVLTDQSGACPECEEIRRLSTRK